MEPKEAGGKPHYFGDSSWGQKDIGAVYSRQVTQSALAFLKDHSVAAGEQDAGKDAGMDGGKDAGVMQWSDLLPIGGAK